MRITRPMILSSSERPTQVCWADEEEQVRAPYAALLAVRLCNLFGVRIESICHVLKRPYCLSQHSAFKIGLCTNTRP